MIGVNFVVSLSMRLLYLHILFLFLASGTHAQDYLSRAKEIRDIDQAQLFANSLPEVVFGFLHEKMPNEDYLSRKNDLKPGDSYQSGSYHVVTIDEGSKEIYRFRLLTMTNQNSSNAKDEIESVFEKLKEGKPYTDLFREYAQNSGPDKGVLGDVGWVDLDFFVDSFQSAVKGKKKGDRFIAGDDTTGWYNIVDITHNPKKMKGHFVLLIPDSTPNNFFNNIDHEKNISKLNTNQEIRVYANKYPGDVQLELLNNVSNRELFVQFNEERELDKKGDVILSEDGRSFQFVKDTSVQLMSIQYVYLNGSSMTREARSEAIHDIYDQFHANVPFDTIVEQYWPGHNGLSVLRNIESGLLADDLVDKVRSTTVGQLFVARVGQSYFLGVPLEKPKELKSMLVISYPKLYEE